MKVTKLKSEYLCSEVMLRSIVHGRFYPDPEHVPDTQRLNNKSPLELQDFKDFYSFRQELTTHDAGSADPAFSILRVRSLDETSPLKLPETPLIPPFNRISQIYDYIIMHEMRLQYQLFYDLALIKGSEPNRYELFKYCDFLYDILRYAHEELLECAGTNPDYEEPDKWFRGNRDAIKNELRLFVFLNVRNRLISLLSTLHKKWPKDLSEYPIRNYRMLFLDVLNTSVPGYEMFVENILPECRRNGCDHKVIHFREAMIILNLFHDKKDDRPRYEKLHQLIDKYDIKYIRNSQKGLCITLCEVKRLLELMQIEEK